MALGSLGRIFVEIGANTDGLERGLDRSRSGVKSLGGAVKKHGVAIGAGMTGMGIASVVASQKCTNSFMAIDTAMAGVRKTTGMTKDEIADMKNAFVGMSKVMPSSAAELANIGQIAGQLGISGKENIMSFTEDIAKMAVAFDMGAEDAATAMAKMAKIYKIPISEVDNLGSAINVLGNTTAATESQIMAYSMTLGAVANTMGFSATESLAMGATLVSMGQDASKAGTGINAALTFISKDTETAAEALGMTEEAFKAAFGKDPMNMMVALAEKIGSIQDPLEQNALAVDVFGSYGAKAMVALSADVEGLKSNLDSSAKGFEENTSLTEEYANAIDTLAAELQLVENRQEAAAMSMGAAMAPATLLVADATATLADGISALPGPLQTVAGTSLVFGQSLTALGPLIMAASTMNWAHAASAWGMIAPYLAVIAPVLAVVAVLYILEKKFGLVTKTIDLAKAGFNVLVDWLSTALVAGIELAKTVISGLGDKLLFVLGPIGAVIYAFRNWEQITGIVSGILNRVVGFITGLTGRFGSAGRGLMNAFVSGVTAGIRRAVAKVREGLAKIRRLMPGSDAKEGPLSDITSSGQALMATFEKGINSSTARPAEAFAARAPDVGAVGNAGVGVGTTSNSSSISIGEVHLSKDYDFEALMKDIDRHQQSKRMQRGIGTI